MGGGLAFLTKKQFNPANISNQKRVWEAEQRAEKEAKAARERAEQLKRERDDEELARARGGRTGGDRASLGFMYGPPPGLADEKKTSGAAGDDNDDGDDPFGPRGGFGDDVDDRKPAAAAADASASTYTANPSDITQRQPGDDDAAAAFRAMLAGHASAGEDVSSASAATAAQAGPSNALVGSEYDPSAAPKVAAAGDGRTQLEKAVGRRDNTALTLEEQVARFPSLKNAPMAPGMKSSNVEVSFKPLGAEIRNVRCLRCGVWGHQRGDRECKLGGWDPFALGSDAVAPGRGTNASGAGVKGDVAGSKQDSAKLEAASSHSEAGPPHPDQKDRYRRKKYSSDSSSSSSSSSGSSSDSDSSEEERRRRRRKKKDRRRKRSSRSSRDDRRRKKRRKDHNRRHRREDGSYDPYEEERRERRRQHRRRERSRSRSRGRSNGYRS